MGSGNRAAEQAYPGFLSRTEGRSPLLKSPLPSEVSTNVPTKVSNKDFFSAAEPPERSQRNHWSNGKVILLYFRVKKYWRTLHECLVLKRGCRSHLSRNLDQWSRKNRDKSAEQLQGFRRPIAAAGRKGAKSPQCRRMTPGRWTNREDGENRSDENRRVGRGTAGKSHTRGPGAA